MSKTISVTELTKNSFRSPCAKGPFRSTLLFIGGRTVFTDGPHGRKKTTTHTRARKAPRPAQVSRQGLDGRPRGPGWPSRWRCLASGGPGCGFRHPWADCHRMSVFFGRRHGNACQTAEYKPGGWCFDADGLSPHQAPVGAVWGAPGGVLRPSEASVRPCVGPREGSLSASAGHRPVCRPSGVGTGRWQRTKPFSRPMMPCLATWPALPSGGRPERQERC